MAALSPNFYSVTSLVTSGRYTLHAQAHTRTAQEEEVGQAGAETTPGTRRPTLAPPHLPPDIRHQAGCKQRNLRLTWRVHWTDRGLSADMPPPIMVESGIYRLPHLRRLFSPAMQPHRTHDLQTASNMGQNCYFTAAAAGGCGRQEEGGLGTARWHCMTGRSGLPGWLPSPYRQRPGRSGEKEGRTPGDLNMAPPHIPTRCAAAALRRRTRFTRHRLPASRRPARGSPGH